MTDLWHTLIARAGFEHALVAVIYSVIVAAFVLSVLLQLAWWTAKRIADRRAAACLDEAIDERRRELDAAFNLTERRR